MMKDVWMCNMYDKSMMMYAVIPMRWIYDMYDDANMFLMQVKDMLMCGFMHDVICILNVLYGYSYD